MMMGVNSLILTTTIILHLYHHHLSAVAVSPPLSTNSRWIVDEAGQRVKLTCVNWPAHLDTVVAEGLSKQPMDKISKKIIKMGFNCVRLTWPLYLATNHSLASTTVKESFLQVGLVDSIAGLQFFNPSILHLSLIDTFKVVVESLTNNKVMVILDNHLSKPGWCCSRFDGNGFFGDQYFDPDLWLFGLTKMATLFNDNPYVVGMSLRNELRGSRQNICSWYRYMQRGAEVVHEANQNVLVILSGLRYDRDFTFLLDQPVTLSFAGKLVFEVHWYGFSEGQIWIEGNPNEVCGKKVNQVMENSGFLLEQGFPLFVSEFGFDFRGTNENDNRYLNCFLAWVADHDLDWALWTLTGSYYLREGVAGMNEYYGLLDWNWVDVRNSSFLRKLATIQLPLRGPGLSGTNTQKIIFHPLTGKCVLSEPISGSLQIDSCSESNQWDYNNQQILSNTTTRSCLRAQGLDQPVRVSTSCSGAAGTIWEPISDSKLHLATTLDRNVTLCLDVGLDNTIISTTCKCLSGDNTCDPASQWFKLVDTSYGVNTNGVIASM